MKTIKITTSNKKLYDRLNYLRFNKEVIVDIPTISLKKMLVNANRRNDNLIAVLDGKTIKIIKKRDCNFNIYLNKKRVKNKW